MSQRGDRGEGHARRPARSSSFGGHRGGGGVGGAGKGGGGSSGQPPLSSNRSFRKSGNGHGGHQRVVSQADTHGFQPAPAPAPLQASPRPPTPQNAPVQVPVPAPRPQQQDLSGVRAPTLPPSGENAANVPPPKSIPHAAPRAPSRISTAAASQGASKGEAITLQFGSFNGLNGVGPGGSILFPARTSSAPPNLDEQKRMQALPEGNKISTPGPVPTAPKQQQQQQLMQQQKQQPQPPPQQARKDAVSSSQSSKPINPHIPSQMKRDVHIPPSVPSIAPPRPPVQQIPGLPISMPYHHQPTLQFGGHNPQIPPQGVVTSSLQMQMGLHGANAPQVAQQMYIPAIQHHQLQAPAMMHQAQGIAYVNSATHPLTTQLGNMMNVGVGPQFASQQPTKYVGPARKTTVKITHPDTHEELKLDKRIDSAGQRGLPSVQQQSQQVSSYGSMGYYPQNSYSQSPIFYPTTTGVSQVPTASQGPRFIAGQTVSFMNQPMNTGSSSNKDSVAGPTAPGHPQVPGKLHLAGHMEKSGVHAVTISAPPGKTDAKLKPTEGSLSHRQKDNEAVSGVTKSGSENESRAPQITEKHSTSGSQPIQSVVASPETTAPATSAVNPLSGADGKIKESIPRIESFKDSNKNAVKDTGNLSQEPQSASSAEDLKVTSLKVVCDGISPMEDKGVNKGLELTNTAEADSKTLKAADASSVDRSSARSTSESTEKPQKVAKTDVAIGESEQTGIAHKISSDLTKDEISSDSTLNESHEVCTLDLPEQSSVGASNPDNSDAMTSLTDQEQLPKEPTPSVSDENPMMNRLLLNEEKMSGSADDTIDSIAISGTSSEFIIQNANAKGDISGETGSAISSTISDVLSVTNSVASEGPLKPESVLKDQSSSAPATSVRPVSREKPSTEANRTKLTAGKKKKRKEMLSKADAAGSSDLYNAYKGPEEKLDFIDATENLDSSIVDHELPDESSEKEVNMGEDEGKRKAELDDWEDAAEMSTLKLERSDSSNQATEANGRKRYSRDFLLTLAPSCTNLPVGFQMCDAFSVLFHNLAGKSYVVDHPSPGRGADRPTSRGDRRGAAMEEDRWKSGHHFGSGRDIYLDNGPPTMNHRGAPGGNHGLRNPRGGPLVGLNAPQMARSGSDADRWQKGLIPSPVTPMQVMHKAEKKYVVGKVSDEEEAKQRQLKAILNKLTPQNFEKLFEKVKEVNIDNVATLTGVISQIFDKALMEPTFCEMYANFCYHLAGALPDFSEDNEKITFKRLLLNKCQEEFERGEREEAEADKTEEEGEIKQTKEEREEKRIRARRRMLGNIRLIGELYKKRMLTERIMHECIKNLLGNCQNPDEENIEALCKLMSTIGEMIDHIKAKEHMDAYFDIMQKLSTSQQLSSRVRFMLRDSIDLRKNKWQQRRKVEGPKKIEEVHRDAAQERHAQSSRLARGSVVGSAPRRGAAPMDYGPRGSAAVLASPSSQQVGHRGMSSHSRGFGTQDIRFEERTVPLPQRKDEPTLTLGPQGGLAKGMRGQPLISNAELSSAVDNRRMVSGPNGYNSASTAREEATSRIPDRSGRMAPNTQFAGPSNRPASQEGRSGNKSYSEDDLREKSVSAIREYYSAKDEKEVALCIEELNAPSFYPHVVSLWVNDSFERKDMERELLTKLFVSLCNSRNNLLSKSQLTEGLVFVLASLEDALSDAPRAAEYLGRLLARFVVESILSLQEVGTLIEQGGEEPGDLVHHGIGADVLGAVLEYIKVEKGDSFLNEAKASSNLKLEDFRPQHLKRSKLDPFMKA
ncbi:eukaryotic translation initiation factor 4G isoform X2 [Oryza brachyantha]|uniref:Eukaryotic translation initiation factor 4G n=1 Tax=Oryza brachyantha TaxID=4533 RepID=J3MLX6_ORYBR|nr:eukaryotic translation initiation factor 4G isoform X2 [Oryza brachyantha]